MPNSAGGVRLSFIRPIEPELVEQPRAMAGATKFDAHRTQAIKDVDGKTRH